MAHIERPGLYKLLQKIGEGGMLAVNEALENPAASHPVGAEVVELRYFVGMTSAEAAEALNISPRTAKYYWTHARAWLYHEITSADAP